MAVSQGRIETQRHKAHGKDCNRGLGPDRPRRAGTSSDGFDVALYDVKREAAEAAKVHIAANLEEQAAFGLIEDAKGFCRTLFRRR